MIQLKRWFRKRDDRAAASEASSAVSSVARAQAYVAEATALADAGDIEAAFGRYRDAYRADAATARSYSRSHYERGVQQHVQHELEQAIVCLRAAISLNPDDPDAHFALGNAQQEAGLPDDALQSYRAAIALRPRFADAHVNAGVILERLGRFVEAADSYGRAIIVRPDDSIAHGNLANALYRSGHYDEALKSFCRAIELNGTPELRNTFVDCLNRCSLTESDESLRRLVARALTDGWGYKSALTKAAVRLIKSDQLVRECIERAAGAWPRLLAADELFGSQTRRVLSNDMLVRALLETAPVDDLPFERCLTMIRRVMLGEAAHADYQPDGPSEDLALESALATQCFVNEYVFSCTVEETSAADALRERIASAVSSGKTIPPMWLVAAASYRPLLAIEGAASLLDRDYPAAVVALLRQQIAEPLEERRDRESIRQLTPIDTGVSTAVRQQYEENPYPRWTRMPVPSKALPIDAFLAQSFPSATFAPIGKTVDLDILVAGCGTGSESTHPAMLFAGANVLAIDLSLASLSYAKRKTRELGLKNIEYAQADITQLGSTKRRFDVVLSSGVLHHLENPVEGLKILVSLLRPGGLMRLAFYSELGRRSVVAARRLIAERGYTSTAADIRRCREALIEQGDEFELLIRSSDFYTTSEVRDALFHVQEHRFTLPQIKAMLADAGLNIVCMIVADATADEYAARFPHDKAKIDLDCWHRFETEFPDTFAAMYRFWVQKPAKA